MKGSNGSFNHTAVSVHPSEAAEQAAFAQSTPPSSEGDGTESAQVRQLYENDGPPLGTLPAVEGRRRTTGRAALLIDKLGERLAFERAGIRLYEALISKHGGPLPISAGADAIQLERLQEICAEEYRHSVLLAQAILELGGDPTAVTPSANVVGVITEGLPKVGLDPRTTFNQCLDAMLVAELADVDAWQVLIALAEEQGHDELAGEFSDAENHEQEHLTTIRSLVMAREAP